MTKVLLIEERKDERLLIATLNRPDAANAIDTDMAQALLDLAARAEQSSHIDAIVLTGGGRSFCSGGDVALFSRTLAGADDADLGQLLEQLATCVHEALLRLVNAGPLIIGAINGAATGAGLGLVCACDIAYASPAARFRAGFSKLGLSPDSGTTWFLPRRIGESAALALLLDGEATTAARAVELGLVNAVIEGDHFLDRVIDRGRIFLASGAALRDTRKLVRAGRTASLDDHLRAEQKTLVALASSAPVQRHLRTALKPV